MEYKKVKLFGKDEDGFYLGRIGDFSIDKGWFGKGSGKITYYVCNRRSMAWVFSIFTGYRQIGRFTTHEIFDRGDLVIAEMKDGKIINLKKGAGEWAKW